MSGPGPIKAWPQKTSLPNPGLHTITHKGYPMSHFTVKAHQVKIKPARTYKTEQNALTAVANSVPGQNPNLRFILMQNPEGRWYPVFLGEPAVQAGAHFHFCVLG